MGMFELMVATGKILGFVDRSLILMLIFKLNALHEEIERKIINNEMNNIFERKKNYSKLRIHCWLSCHTFARVYMKTNLCKSGESFSKS